MHCGFDLYHTMQRSSLHDHVFCPVRRHEPGTVGWCEKELEDTSLPAYAWSSRIPSLTCSRG
jgi:hypothetical protein